MIRSVKLSCLAALAACLAACTPDALLVSVTGNKNQTITTQVGFEVDITVQSVGPGSFTSPPSISTPNVSFLGDSPVTPGVPAGVTQMFRFRAESGGTAIIDIVNPSMPLTVEDTVVVQGPG